MTSMICHDVMAAITSGGVVGEAKDEGLREMMYGQFSSMIRVVTKRLLIKRMPTNYQRLVGVPTKTTHAYQCINVCIK